MTLENLDPDEGETINERARVVDDMLARSSIHRDGRGRPLAGGHPPASASAAPPPGPPPRKEGFTDQAWREAWAWWRHDAAKDRLSLRGHLYAAMDAEISGNRDALRAHLAGAEKARERIRAAIPEPLRKRPPEELRWSDRLLENLRAHAGRRGARAGGRRGA